MRFVQICGSVPWPRGCRTLSDLHGRFQDTYHEYKIRVRRRVERIVAESCQEIAARASNQQEA